MLWSQKVSVTLLAALRVAVGMVLGNVTERRAPGEKFMEKVFLILYGLARITMIFFFLFE